MLSSCADSKSIVNALYKRHEMWQDNKKIALAKATVILNALKKIIKYALHFKRWRIPLKMALYTSQYTN